MPPIHSPSPNFNERHHTVDTILIHYTDMPTAEDALAWLTNPTAKVSAHYLIGENGKVYHMVSEELRAWHAGESYWQGCTDLNGCSIGIELANPGHSHGYVPFPEAQIESLIRLCQDIQGRWNIPRNRILGHSDVAPRRKQDPGHLFPWDTLAQEGLGLWPLQSYEHNSSDELLLLQQIGYETTSPSHSLLAFQRHFQPHKLDGVADDETFALLHGLLKASKNPI